MLPSKPRESSAGRRSWSMITPRFASTGTDVLRARDVYVCMCVPDLSTTRRFLFLCTIRMPFGGHGRSGMGVGGIGPSILEMSEEKLIVVRSK